MLFLCIVQKSGDKTKSERRVYEVYASMSVRTVVCIHHDIYLRRRPSYMRALPLRFRWKPAHMDTWT